MSLTYSTDINGQTGALEEWPLLSAQVLHYNNGDLIFETLDSIFKQDYPCIELIVSDDCSPAGFDQDAISRYIEQKKRTNICRWQVRQNDKNEGTVRHLELLRELTQGEILLPIAADDIWRYEGAFSDFYSAFSAHGTQCEWVVSQVEMRDASLQQSEGFFVQAQVVQMLQRGQYKKLLNREISACLLPGCGSAYRKGFFEKLGILSSHYHLVEDYSAHLRALRMGIRVFYLDQVTVLHRRGGISHGNTRNGQRLYLRYQQDFLTAYRLEIRPYRQSFGPLAYSLATLAYWNNLLLYHTVRNELRYGAEAHRPVKENRVKKILWQYSRLGAIKRTALLCGGLCIGLLLLGIIGFSCGYAWGYLTAMAGLGLILAQLTVNIGLKLWRLASPFLCYRKV